jgi:hypothetical protein
VGWSVIVDGGMISKFPSIVTRMIVTGTSKCRFGHAEELGKDIGVRGRKMKWTGSVFEGGK